MNEVEHIHAELHFLMDEGFLPRNSPAVQGALTRIKANAAGLKEKNDRMRESEKWYRAKIKQLGDESGISGNVA